MSNFFNDLKSKASSVVAHRQFKIGLPRVLGIIVVLIFFGHFTFPALGVRFAPDEMMNLYGSWHPGFARVLEANVSFWSTFTRPMGGLYYLVTFSLVGFNPEPFNAARITVLLLTAILFYFLSSRILDSRVGVIMATLIVAYHAGMSNLAYNGSFIYDVLCAFFYFSTVLFYICERSSGGLNGLRFFYFLVLFICALNSKEMAVSLPVVIFGYELVLGQWRSQTIFQIIRTNAALIMTILITIVFIMGKAYGPASLMRLDPYKPQFNWEMFSNTSVRYLNTIFYTEAFSMRIVISLWIALLLIAWWRKDRLLAWLWIWIMVTPLPISFLSNRGQGCLYIVTAGWALVIVSLVDASISFLVESFALSDVLRQTVKAALFICMAYYYYHETASRHKHLKDAFLSEGDKTFRLIQAFRVGPPAPPPNSRALILNDPFPNGYDAQFVASLWWHDKTINVNLQNQVHLSDEEIRQIPYLYQFVGSSLVQIRP